MCNALPRDRVHQSVRGYTCLAIMLISDYVQTRTSHKPYGHMHSDAS